MGKSEIKSMNLYSQVDRVFNDLRAAGIADDAPVDVATLSQFDQYHYFGTDAVDEAIAAAAVSESSRVLDIGSGLGGPARYLADRTGCRRWGLCGIRDRADSRARAPALACWTRSSRTRPHRIRVPAGSTRACRPRAAFAVARSGHEAAESRPVGRVVCHIQ